MFRNDRHDNDTATAFFDWSRSHLLRPRRPEDVGWFGGYAFTGTMGFSRVLHWAVSHFWPIAAEFSADGSYLRTARSVRVWRFCNMIWPSPCS